MIKQKKTNLYLMISVLTVVFNAHSWLLRTVNCDVNKRIKATWCLYIKQVLRDGFEWNVMPLLGHFGGRVGICGIL